MKKRLFKVGLGIGLLGVFSYFATKNIVNPLATLMPSRVIYLTSDDGPLAGTVNLNRSINRLKVPITLFVVGKPPHNSKRLMQYYRMCRENRYVTIGNHSFTHANFHYKKYYLNPDTVIDDMKVNEKFLNITSNMVRLPGRNIWRLKGRSWGCNRPAGVSAIKLRNMGYDVYGWDVEWHYTKDGKPKESAKKMFKTVEKKFRYGRLFTPHHLVLLMHDEMFWGYEGSVEFERFVKMIKGSPLYKFDLLENYPRGVKFAQKI